MKQLVLVVLVSLAGAICFAQGNRNYGSVGGFGNVLYPGTGHAPAANVPSFAHRLGQNVAGQPLPGRPYRAGSNRTLIVPFPVYYGPLYGGGYDQAPQQQYQDPPPPIINTNTAPSVVINQTFVPERAMPLVREYDSPSDQPQQGMRQYQGPQSGPMPEPSRSANTTPKQDGQPTLYLIAFRDNSIVQALGYWVEDGNLHYVSAGHTLNQVSLDLIDRDLSQRLNDERGIEFKLPR
ncbi:MAG: hypothetical protein ACR2NN_04320 [Bryobacteraceae bacterium]